MVHPGWTLPPLMLQSHSNQGGRDLCCCRYLCTGTQPTVIPSSARWETCHQHSGMAKAPAVDVPVIPTPADPNPLPETSCGHTEMPQGNTPLCRYRRKAGFGCATLTLNSHHPFPRVGAQLHSMPGKANTGRKKSRSTRATTSCRETVPETMALPESRNDAMPKRVLKQLPALPKSRCHPGRPQSSWVPLGMEQELQGTEPFTTPGHGAIPRDRGREGSEPMSPGSGLI